jgi:phasin
MSNDPIKNPAELFNLSGANVREIAEKGVAQTREAFEKLNASAKDAAGSLEASASVVAQGLSEFNAKAFEALQANTYLTLDFLASLAAVKSPGELAPLQSAFAEKQFKALTEQAKDLTALAQKVSKEAAEPLKGQIEKTIKSVG